MAEYPTSVPTITDPTSTDYLTSPAHAALHAQENGEIVAIATELGTDPAGAYADVKARLDAVDASLATKVGSLTGAATNIAVYNSTSDGIEASGYTVDSFAPITHITSDDHDTRYYTQAQVTSAVAAKQDLVVGATLNNFAAWDGSGQTKDSGSAASDFDPAGTAAAAIVTHLAVHTSSVEHNPFVVGSITIDETDIEDNFVLTFNYETNALIYREVTGVQQETVEDWVAAMMQTGTGPITWTYNDAAGTLTANLPQSVATTATPNFAGLQVTADGYLSWGATYGTTGYGLRDNSGTIEFKDSGGAWASIATGSGAPTDAQYLTLAVNGTLTDERVLTGTANQITITDGGAGTTATLSLPQDIATSSTVTFGQILSGAGFQAAADNYYNFGATAGSTGYGFRDNSGTIQYKDSGGAWSDIPSGASPNTAQYVTLAVDAGLPNERVLTGTSNQITITDAGAGSTVTLSTPQDIDATANPTFSGLNLSASSGVVDLLFQQGSDIYTVGMVNSGDGRFHIYDGTAGQTTDILQAYGGDMNIHSDLRISAGSWQAPTHALEVNGYMQLGTTTAVNAILDDDTMAGDSAISLVTQQSVKAYFDNIVKAGLTTQILVGGGVATTPVWGTDLPTAVTIGSSYIYRAGGTDVPVTDGGTGVSTLTDGGILLGSGTSAVTALGQATNGQIPIGSTGGDPTLATITGTAGQITVTNGAGTITLSAPTVTASTVINENNIMLNAFRIAILGSLSVQQMVDGFVDEYEDETGIDSGSSSNYTYNSSLDYISPTVLSGTTKRPDDYSTDLQGYWKLDEASGNRADSSGNSNTLADNNSVLSCAGYYDPLCADFEASNSEYLTITDGSQTGLELTGTAWTVFARVRCESATQGTIVEKGYATGYWIGVNASLQIEVNYGSATRLAGNASVPLNEWVDICVQYDGSSVYAWVNGVLDKVTACTTDVTDTASNFYIGSQGSSTNFFDGCIADVAIWDRVLTEAQISSMSGLKYGNSKTQNDSLALGTTNSKLAQAFVPLTDGNFEVVEVRGLKSNSPTTETFVIRIETDSSDAPSGTLVDANAYSDEILVANLNTTNDWVAGALQGAISLTAGTKYWIVIQTATGSWGSDFWNWRGSSSSTYAGGHADRYTSGAWQGDVDAKDLNFYMSQVVGDNITSISLGYGTYDEYEFASNSSYDKFAQNIKYTSDTTIYGVAFFLNKNNSPTFTIQSKIYSDSGADPDTVLATSNSINVTNMETATGYATDSNFQWVYFEFSGGYTLSANTEYWISVESPDTTHDGANYMGIKRIASSTFTQTTPMQYYNGSWNEVASSSLCMVIFDEEPAGSTLAMTLVSESQTAESAPTSARIILFEEDVDSITLNTDIIASVSEDNGSNWHTVTLSDDGNYEGTTKRILSGDVALTDEADTDIVYKIVSANDKVFNLHGTSVTWR